MTLSDKAQLLRGSIMGMFGYIPNTERQAILEEALRLETKNIKEMEKWNRNT